MHRADNPIGEWNKFRILMTGDKVTVYLKRTNWSFIMSPWKIQSNGVRRSICWARSNYKTTKTPSGSKISIFAKSADKSRGFGRSRRRSQRAIDPPFRFAANLASATLIMFKIRNPILTLC